MPLAEAMIEPGDAVLVKGSRSVGLELVTDELRAHRGAPETMSIARGQRAPRRRSTAARS